MDDFLHNLRSGKLKQPERPNRPYNDQQYKGGQRRNMNPMDRHKRENDSKESLERLNAIKEVIESLSEGQKRLAAAYEARTAVETRKAQALEILAKNIYRMINPNASDIDRLFETPIFPEKVETPATKTTSDALSEEFHSTAPSFEEQSDKDDTVPMPVVEQEEAPVQTAPSESARESNKLGNDDRQAIVAMIRQMRGNGDNWEQIARHIADKGYPTLSGKGSWRGIMAKTLYDKMTA